MHSRGFIIDFNQQRVVNFNISRVLQSKYIVNDVYFIKHYPMSVDYDEIIRGNVNVSRRQQFRH